MSCVSATVFPWLATSIHFHALSRPENPGGSLSVADAERGAVLGPAVAPVVEAGGADVGVAEPVLDAGDVGLVLEGVGGGRGPERVDDALHGDGGGRGVLPDELVDAVAGERPAGPAGPGRLEEGCVPVVAVPGELEVVAEGRERGRVDRVFEPLPVTLKCGTPRCSWSDPTVRRATSSRRSPW